MFAQFAALDAFLAPRLVRPFYLLGLALALLWTLIGLFASLVLLVQLPLLGVLAMAFVLASAAFGILAVRIAAEAAIAVFRMHVRFVGGGPNDPIPD